MCSLLVPNDHQLGGLGGLELTMFLLDSQLNTQGIASARLNEEKLNNFVRKGVFFLINQNDLLSTTEAYCKISNGKQ